MKAILLDLLESLESIGNSHGEIYDSEVRDQMGVAIMEAFVRRRPDYVVPSDLGMCSDEANLKVSTAITLYVDQANREAETRGLIAFHDRLNALQDEDVKTADQRNDYDEFLGHTPPEFYDRQGNVIRTQ